MTTVGAAGDIATARVIVGAGLADVMFGPQP